MNKKTINFLMELLVLIVVFLVPTIFDRRLGIVFSGAKVSFMRLFAIVILALWLIKIIIAKKHKFIRTPLDWPIVSFLLCVLVASITSVHVFTSLAGFYGRYEGFSSWIVFGVFFFAVTNFIFTIQQIKRIIVTVLSAATLMAGYSLLQRHSLDPYMWGGVVTWQRVIGTIGQPNFLAAYMLMAFFLILGLLLTTKESKAGPINWPEQLAPLGYFFAAQLTFIIMIYSLDVQNVFAWYFGFTAITVSALLFSFAYEKLHPLILNLILGFGLLLIYISILYTQSRGGYMGLFCGLVLFVLVAGRDWVFASWKKMSILAFLIILISGITMLRPEFSLFERFSAEISTQDVEGDKGEAESKLELKGAAGSRGETWKSAFKIIADYPVFGIGPEDLKMVFPRYETDLFRFKETFHVKQDRCHNETFDVPVTKGLIALAIYLWLLFVCFRVGWLKSRKFKKEGQLLLAGMLAAMLAYLIQNQFSFGVVAIVSLFWIIWAMVMIIDEDKTSEETDKKTYTWQEIPWLSVAAVVVLALFFTYISFLSFRGDIMFKMGKSRLQFNQIPEAVNDLEESLVIYPFEGGTISHLGIAYLNLSRIPNQQAQALDKAVQILKYGTKVDAYNADNFFMLAKIYWMLYKTSGNKNFLDEAYNNAQISIKIDPYYAEVFDLLGVMEEDQGRASQAAPLYEKAFMTNPTLPEPLAKLERIQGSAFSQTLEKIYLKYNDNLLILEKLSYAYLNSNQLKKASKLIKRLKALYPEDSLGNALLGEYYLKNSQIDKAEALFQDIIFKDPKNVAAHVGMAQVYLRTGRAERAKEEIQQILMLDPNNAWAKGRL